MSKGDELRVLNLTKEEILQDYRLANESRQASLIGRREVLMGKANFGIFGDGKELPQIALSKTFQNGDFRSGYYRDQTFALATGMTNLYNFFAQLYGDTNINNDPHSAGRQMNCHYSTRSLNDDGSWKNLMKMKNSSADISCTAGQMQRLLGLAYASKLYRNNPELAYLKNFSVNGNEVAFGTIGNASTAEGPFFEAINAAGVLMVPIAMSIWDDGFGISVPNIYQITKSSISEVLKGFKYNDNLKQGFLIYTVKGWDYISLVKAYKEGVEIVRREHIPAIFHITELTQPLGHSTSGSHERYKTKERLQWEKDYDCIAQFRKWIINEEITEPEELDRIENESKEKVRKIQRESYDAFINPIRKEMDEASKLFIKIADFISSESKNSEISEKILSVNNSMLKSFDKNRRTILQSVYDVLLDFNLDFSSVATKVKADTGKMITSEFSGLPSGLPIGLPLGQNSSKHPISELIQWKNDYEKKYNRTFDLFLHSETNRNAMYVEEVKPVYSDNSPLVDGREILLSFFDKAFERDPRIFAIGEDVGMLGDVNQGMAGLQAKYGDIRITDTGIRESTIVGQGIGAALRGLKPIVEIQYLDYLLYALQVISDDLASLHYRSAGGQIAPVIIRTRGHRLVGIWHSGSPLGTIINSFRGLYVCVPRNMTQAAGFYNTLLKSDEPGLVIERLNAYRYKEKLPDNITDITVPLGNPEILIEGKDITIVTYGSCVDIAINAIEKLNKVGISVELIDVQTLLPFDLYNKILESIKKTNRVLFLDEDVPGGASAYMLQKVIDEQNGYKYLDSKPTCLSAKPHRPAYGNDGDYFSKPNAEDVFKKVYEIMNEANPINYPIFF